MRIISLCLLSLLAITAFAADVTGKWTSSMQGPDGGSIEIQYAFKADGQKLEGTMTGPMGEMPISEGKLDGDKISFAMDAGGFKLEFKGTVADNEIKLQMQVGERTIDTVLKRAKS
jgi:hypothetical protein